MPPRSEPVILWPRHRATTDANEGTAPVAKGEQTQVLNRRIFYAGDTIFNEGERGTQAFVVQSGRVRIVRALTGGERGTLGFIEAGGIFGEMALIDDAPRMASAVADETTVCIAVPQESVTRKLQAADRELRMVIVMMIRMIRTITDETPIPSDAMRDISDAARAGSAP